MRTVIGYPFTADLGTFLHPEVGREPTTENR
jgi:hypothetical protein